MLQQTSLRKPDESATAPLKFSLRDLKTKDCPILERLLSRIPVFDRDDQALAMELIYLALSQSGQKDYAFFIAADEEDFPIGYACFGPTPLTEGTFDLYWIAVDPACAGQGVGTRLLMAVEGEIRTQKGRLLVIETSSGRPYTLTRQFYLKNGYQLAETIPDFFREGEDRVTYVKKL
jgi:ribosomal protein S18 acetylase RimI-like enzyme